MLESIAVAHGYTCQIPIEGFWERLQTHPNYDSDSDGVNKSCVVGSFLKWLAAKHPDLKTIGEITVEIAGEYLNKVWQTGITGLTYNVKLWLLIKHFVYFKEFIFNGIITKTFSFSIAKTPAVILGIIDTFCYRLGQLLLLIRGSAFALQR